MKTKHLLIPFVLVAVIVALLWWRGDHSPARTNTDAESNIAPALVVATNQKIKPFARSAPVAQAAPAYAAPGPYETEIALAQQWMSAARLFRCDPTVTNVLERTNRRTGRATGLHILTPTHLLTVTRRADGLVVDLVVSHYDTDRETPPEEWHKLTGKPKEQELIAEAYAVLRRLGDSQPLSATNYQATPMPLRTPEGNTITNTPFVHVEFSDASGKSIADLQYRMEASGPELTRFWYWPIQLPDALKTKE